MKLKSNSVSPLRSLKSFTLGVFAIFALSSSVFAQETPPVPALPVSLKETMKGMSEKLKTITAQATDATHNADSQKLAEDFVALSTHAKTFVPKKVDALAPADKGPALDKYAVAIDQATDLGQQLVAAFKTNDNTKAADLLNKLAAAKKDGHTAFK